MRRRALMSVYDKTGIVAFARGVHELGYEIVSTGGTERVLREAGVPVTPVTQVTGFPEILSGRVKTLHPSVFGGILALRGDKSHMAELEEQKIVPVDLVVVNLYPFAATVARQGVALSEALENIDIGGPAMIRAAAKNFTHVAVVTSPQQYSWVLEEMRARQGLLSEESRRKLAVEAFALTARYDAAIETFLRTLADDDATLPGRIWLSLDRVAGLRYGENPHQRAALYAHADAAPAGLLTAKQLQGKELSFNNYLDAHAALGLLAEFDEPCAVILKHNNPCGAAVADDVLAAYRKALATDPVSAFGGIVGVNRPVTAELAQELSTLFLEVVLAPHFTPEAQQILGRKKNLRLLQLDDRKETGSDSLDIKCIAGGYLVQERDYEPAPSLKVVTKRQPSAAEWQALRFGWKVVKWVKSNAVVFVGADRTLGIGAGQMSRVDSSRIAVMKAEAAGLSLHGSVVASDAFFPFRDGVDAAAEAGATAVIQPGGSVRDDEVIAAAEEHDMAMVFTGVRHFRH
ncbi:MAG: bifunctional phosphoribosylaminoimidazolecarboxamide formyltransferase/IMP cyclohydrolase [candidate division KSB1 bacterium]|nr:bifunctional phosphoribosylaminoimidazolecarboxamide formyltransferase/IMP cyclohydrolase [candidate division KSB1 bacterium]